MRKILIGKAMFLKLNLSMDNSFPWFPIVILTISVNIFVSCNQPMKPDINSEDYLSLTASYDPNFRVVKSLPITLTWSEITVDNFKVCQIERLNLNRPIDSYPVGETTKGWKLIKEIYDEFIHEYVDSIYDDAQFKYRIRYIDFDGNYIEATTHVNIRLTTHLTIPTDNWEIKDALDSYILDDSDTLFIKAGDYYTPSFSFNDKSISLIGLDGARNTDLYWIYTHALVETKKDSTFISIKDGLIQGLSIRDSDVMRGGGVSVLGNAIIRQCIIINNKALTNPYSGAIDRAVEQGGGIYIRGNASIENCIIADNVTGGLGSGIFIDQNSQNVKIINCTLYNNDIYSNSKNVSIQNTIIENQDSTILTSNSITLQEVKYSYAGEIWQVYDSTNVVGNILMSNPPLDLHLLPGSLGIDNGNPHNEFNDTDGSRNNLGAYGGPGGDWH
jgi:hypothetical protein